MPIDARDLEKARRIMNDRNTKWVAVGQGETPELTEEQKREVRDRWNQDHPPQF